MSDRRFDATPRRPRLGWLALIVALALIVGVALMIYAVQRSGGWFIRQPEQPAAPSRAATYTPPQPRAVTVLTAGSHQPVTLATLRTAFDTHAGALQSGGDGDWLSSLSRELRTLVVLHDEATPSPLPSARVARTRRLLDSGQVLEALAEAQRLPGARTARDWFAAAHRYLRTRAALDAIEAAALTAPVAVTLPAAAPTPAPTEPTLP